MVRLTSDFWCNAHEMQRIEIKSTRDGKFFVRYTLKDGTTFLSKNYDDLIEVRCEVRFIVDDINEELRYENH